MTALMVILLVTATQIINTKGIDMADSSDIPVADNFQPVPGVDYGEKVETPVETTPVEPTPAPEPTEPPVVEPEKPVEPAPEPKAEPPKVERSQKPKPIASLLEKKHELETQLESEKQERQKEREELQAQIAKLSNAPVTPQNIEDVKQLAETYGMDENILSDIIKVARKGTELPQEVQNLIAERQEEKLQAEEMAGFTTRLDSLAKALPNEQFSDPSVREQLLGLAYSTELAPDGEPYFKKELSELYFAYIKPEIEPGKPSAEASQGGTQQGTVIDFEEIYTRDNPKDIVSMDSATFEKYNTWVREHKESQSPLKRTG